MEVPILFTNIFLLIYVKRGKSDEFTGLTLFKKEEKNLWINYLIHPVESLKSVMEWVFKFAVFLISDAKNMQEIEHYYKLNGTALTNQECRMSVTLNPLRIPFKLGLILVDIIWSRFYDEEPERSSMLQLYTSYTSNKFSKNILVALLVGMLACIFFLCGSLIMLLRLQLNNAMEQENVELSDLNDSSDQDFPSIIIDDDGEIFITHTEKLQFINNSK